MLIRRPRWATKKIEMDYTQLIIYIKRLRTYFRKEYESKFTVGKLNQGSMDFTYFSLTTQELKKEKLKFVIIFNHQKMQFEICLSGQNRNIRKRYWEIFKESAWGKYHLVESIDSSLSIIDNVIIVKPNFGKPERLTKRIETRSLQFMNEVIEFLDRKK